MLEEALKLKLQTKTQFHMVEPMAEANMTDGQLVEAVLSGDESAFAVIFERYKRPMARVVGRFFREHSQIDEGVQQCFTKAYFSLKNYRGGEERSFAAWMTRIAVNVCYDEFRKRGRRAESLFTEMSDEENEYIESVASTGRGDAEQTLVAAQLSEKVLAGLDPRDRIAMTLVYSEDYSLNEVAEAIGITTSNLKSRLFRCRNHIRTRFGHLFS